MELNPDKRIDLGLNNMLCGPYFQTGDADTILEKASHNMVGPDLTSPCMPIQQFRHLKSAWGRRDCLVLLHHGPHQDQALTAF